MGREAAQTPFNRNEITLHRAHLLIAQTLKCSVDLRAKVPLAQPFGAAIHKDTEQQDRTSPEIQGRPGRDGMATSLGVPSPSVATVLSF